MQIIDDQGQVQNVIGDDQWQASGSHVVYNDFLHGNWMHKYQENGIR